MRSSRKVLVALGDMNILNNTIYKTEYNRATLIAETMSHNF